MVRIMLLLSVFVPVLAQAAPGYAGVRTIQTVQVEGWSNFVRIQGDTVFDNPMQCGQSDAVLLLTDTPHYASYLAAIMTAFASEKPVQFWVAGCQLTPWGFTLPVITSVITTR